jgi:hypothetical protein
MHGTENLKFILLSCVSSTDVSRTSGQQYSADIFGFHLPLYPAPHSGYILMEPFTVLVRDGCHISRKKKLQVGLQEMKFSTTCYTPSQGMWKVAPPL